MRTQKFKRGLKKTPFKFWLPGQDSLHFIQGKLTKVLVNTGN